MKRGALICGMCSGAAALLAAGALAAGATRSAAGCRATNFYAFIDVIHGSAGAGSISYRLRLKNNGSAKCRMGNHAGLQLEKADGKDLPTHVHQRGAAGVVTVAAGAVVKAELRFSPDVPGPGEPKDGACEPKASLAVVSLASPGKGATIGRVRPRTPVCSHGSIQESPLH